MRKSTIQTMIIGNALDIGLNVEFVNDELTDVIVCDKVKFGLYMCKETGEYPSEAEMERLVEEIKSQFKEVYNHFIS